MTALFIGNAIIFGIGLAMDAFSVSLANGLSNPNMGKKNENLLALTFAFFQTLMPLIGWFCVHTIFILFESVQKFIPWIAFLVLAILGNKMIIESKNNESDEPIELTFKYLLISGIATSIDALSVGFTIAELDFFYALIESLIIGVVTYIICMAGVLIGRKFGTRLKNYLNFSWFRNFN